MFIYGVVLFTIASGLCAAADSVGQLVAFRVLQGVGAAILVPASLALVVEGFDAARRAHGVSLWGARRPSHPVWVHPWRCSSGRVELALGVFGESAAGRRGGRGGPARVGREPRLRTAARARFTGGGVAGARTRVPDARLGQGPGLGLGQCGNDRVVLAGVVAMVGFVLSSRSHPTPLIEPAFLRVRSFTAGNTLTLVASAGFYAYLLTHVLFLNYVWHYNLLRAGLAVAPAAFVAAAVAAVLGRVADRRGYRPIVSSAP